MDYKISVLFRAIPLLLGAVSAGLGAYVLAHDTGPGAFVAGRVLICLAGICVCLFATASVIIRQLIGRFAAADRFGYPLLAAAVAAGLVGYGLSLFSGDHRPDAFTAGHVVTGIGLVCGCVFAVVTASTRFTRIPANSEWPEGAPPPAGTTFSAPAVQVLTAIPIALSVIAWGLAFALLAGVGDTTGTARATAGHVLIGLAAVCTSLIALVVSILRQIQNSYTARERDRWPLLPVAMGVLALVWGIVLAVRDAGAGGQAAGFLLMGLGMICLSILSKVLLLALVWRRAAPLANRVPLIPVGTALACLFLAGFVYESGLADLLIAARVLTGFGAVCFSLFSIVSILESGTAG